MVSRWVPKEPEHPRKDETILTLTRALEACRKENAELRAKLRGSIEDPLEIPTDERICPVCDKPFTPKRMSSKFCSAPCRAKGNRK